MKQTKESAITIAKFRYSVISELLIHRHSHGQLKSKVIELSRENWMSPGGKSVKIPVSTIERWYYKARKNPDPVAALTPAWGKTSSRQSTVTKDFATILNDLRQLHPRWTTKLLHDNATIVARRENIPVPSYDATMRYCRRHGLRKQASPLKSRRHQPLLYEMPYANSMWHLDFHHGKSELYITNSNGKLEKPYLIIIKDDYSRFITHAQWYLSESGECLVHALSQAILKFGIPAVIYQDNGAAMVCAEYKEGLKRLGCSSKYTRVKSPYMNGKAESLFARIEQRCLASIAPGLTLEQLNLCTNAWIHGEHNHGKHRSLDQKPAQRFNSHKVGRPAPNDPEILRKAFTITIPRMVRKSDNSITVDGIRFQLPDSYVGDNSVKVAYARWDLSWVHLVHPVSGEFAQRIFPVNPESNAQGKRLPKKVSQPSDLRVSPLMGQYIRRYQELFPMGGHIASPVNQDKNKENHHDSI